MSTHKLSLTSLPPWLPQDYHSFMCSCLVLLKTKQNNNKKVSLAAFKMNSESIGRNPAVTETHSYRLCASVCACSSEGLGIHPGSNTTDEVFFPLFTPCLASNHPMLVFCHSHCHTCTYVLIYLTSQQPAFSWEGQKNAIQHWGIEVQAANRMQKSCGKSMAEQCFGLRFPYHNIRLHPSPSSPSCYLWY